jgi:shikimate dehydrogenase
MSSSIPLLIVTLPGRTVAEVRNEVDEARAGGADIAEVRIDRWSSAERDRLGELFPSSLPLMATLRSRAEGGEGPDAPEERRRLLEAMTQLPFRWIDLEDARDRALLPLAGATSDRVQILSAHLPAGTPPAEVVRRALEGAPPGTVRKLVVPASVGELLDGILPSLREMGLASAVVLTTGPSGALLRAWSGRFHYPFVFASLPETHGAGPARTVEPSQIPVDRLQRYLAEVEPGPLFAVVGHPVAHSQSPYLHSRWMRSSRRSGLYVALDLLSEVEFVEALEPLVSGGFRGVNVTHPWKSSALAAATRVGRGAALCGTANCLTFRDGEVEAENTDLVAVLRRFDELRASGAWGGGELAVVGAGGAAAATLAAAREVDVPAFLVARSAEKAGPLAHRFGATLLPATEARAFSLVVHATDVGRDGAGPLDAPLAKLVGPDSRVLDWVYAPTFPEIRTTAENAGATYEDGWRLLVYQAAASFGVWWGTEPPPEEVDRTIEEGPCTA